MKNKLLLLLLLLFCGCAQQSKIKKNSNDFTLKGTITGKHGQVIWLRYPDINGEIIQQQAIIKNDSFIFKGSLSSPVNAEFSDEFYPNISYIRNFSSVTFLSPGDMTVSVDSNSINAQKLTGSIMQDDWDGLQIQKSHLVKIKDSLYTEMFKVERAGNTPTNHAAHITIVSKIDQCTEKEKQLDYGFIQSHPNSYLSPYLTEFYFNGMRELPLDSAVHFYSSLSTQVKNSVAGRQLGKLIIYRKNFYAGAVAKLPAGKALSGQPIDLQSFKNKDYVLLYFWASWCNSCLAEIPHIKSLYDKYHSNGFEIIGLASDDQSHFLHRAILKNKISNWHHIVLNPVSTLDSLYDMSSLSPSLMILIDKRGVIIGRYRGAQNNINMKDNYDKGGICDLDKKLIETFGY